MERLEAYPPGHFYSPVVSLDDIAPRRADVWSPLLENAGIDFNFERHRKFIKTDLRQALPKFEYPDFSENPTQYYQKNPAFSWLDSRALFTMLLKMRPKKMVEVGSGFSSLLTADVNVRMLGGSMEFTCIEPFPKNFLKNHVAGLSRLIESPVQSVSMDVFRALGKGDVLFIDSSHVSKTGSDVNFLVFEVLPALRRGVIVHFHDIFLPREYPEHWVIQHRLSWNEQYVVRALLMGSKVFEVLFGCAFALYACADDLKDVLSGEVYGGGSLWLQKAGDF